MARTINDAVTEICSLRHGIENAAWEEARGKLMAYLRLKGSCCGGDQEEYDALNNVIKKFIERIDEDDIYSPDPDEIVRLRGEVERLTLERDYWARARNEWEKSARLLEEENKRLTREKDEALHDHAAAMRASLQMKERAEAAERERDEALRLRYCAEDDAAIVKEQYDALLKNSTGKIATAEAKVAKLRGAWTEARPIVEWAQDKLSTPPQKVREIIKEIDGLMMEDSQ